jgi:hypothetical protein
MPIYIFLKIQQFPENLLEMENAGVLPIQKKNTLQGKYVLIWAAKKFLQIIVGAIID